MAINGNVPARPQPGTGSRQEQKGIRNGMHAAAPHSRHDMVSGQEPCLRTPREMVRRHLCTRQCIQPSPCPAAERERTPAYMPGDVAHRQRAQVAAPLTGHTPIRRYGAIHHTHPRHQMPQVVPCCPRAVSAQPASAARGAASHTRRRTKNPPHYPFYMLI